MDISVDIEKLETLALFAQAEQTKWQSAGAPWPRPTAALTEMLIAASPLTVLELIAEIKQLRQQLADDELQAQADAAYDEWAQERDK